MQFVYTIHAENKLRLWEIVELAIDKKKIEKTVKTPTVVDKSELPVIIAIGKLNKELSLCVAYKKTTGKKVKIITFYPAERGRYESKILKRR